MTITSPTTPASSDTAGGAITRLNPSDGLFLRAEHLRVMQDYASDLALAIGLAGGPGVVHGFKVSLSQDHGSVQVTGGLAVDPQGRPLRSKSGVEASVTALQPAADEFYVVEIEAASWSFGSEGVYGALCDDPCGDGATIAPYVVEGIKLTLRLDEFPGQLDLVAEKERRNRLASLYFERERANGGHRSVTGNTPWVMPNARSAVISSLLGRAWEDGTSAPIGSAVPLAVLLRVDGEWVLDTWTARRDVADPPPRGAWQWRLGMRPWNVFIAQVLQLEDQLSGGSGLVPPSEKVARAQVVEELVAEVRAISRSPKLLASANQAERRNRLEKSKRGSLVDSGISELPPAGYLALDGTAGAAEVERFATLFFGTAVDVDVREVRADYVAHAVEQVQHMDRIPLENDGGPTPQIDVLVPMRDRVDLDPLRPDGDYGWVAYVRRRDEQPVPPDQTPEQLEDVEVYVATLDLGGVNEFDKVAQDLMRSGIDQRFKRIGVVSYPVGRWAVPVDKEGSAYRDVQDMLDDGSWAVRAVVGLTTSPGRQPLAAARSWRMVVPDHAQGQHLLGWVPTYVTGDAAREAIFVMLGPASIIN